MKYCSNCVTRFNDGDSFCQNCGAPFSPALGVNVNQGAQVYSEPKDYNLFTAWISMWKRAFDFKGRSRRKELWLAILANILFSFGIIIISVLLTGLILNVTDDTSIIGVLLTMTIPIAIFTIYWIAAFIPGLSLAVRRLHDTDQSGKFLLVALLGIIPIVGWIVNIILLVNFCTEGDLRTNKYGPSPK